MSQDQIPSALSAVTDKPIVEARFHLVEVKSHQTYGDTGFNTAKAVTITLQAAKSGIFGKASPSGRMEMMIANPGAYEVFENAFNEQSRAFYDPEVPSPKMGTKRFRVYIVEDEDQTPA